MKDRLHSIVICSGGMDSTVALAMEAASFGPLNVGAVFFNYGQRTAPAEHKSFYHVCRYYGIVGDHRWYFNLKKIFRIIGGSALLTDEQLEEGSLDKEHIPSTYVPFRNAQLLSVAVALADSLNCRRVVYGAHLEDRIGYPDCSAEFVSAMCETAMLGTKNKVAIIAPFVLSKMTKSQIVNKGWEYKVPFELTWSCYQNTDVACGECDSCLLRLRAFQDQGVFGEYDPLEYEKYPKWYAPDDEKIHPELMVHTETPASEKISFTLDTEFRIHGTKEEIEKFIQNAKNALDDPKVVLRP